MPYQNTPKFKKSERTFREFSTNLTMKTSGKETKAYIKKLKEQLQERGILDSIDEMALTLIENTHRQYIEASNYLTENGSIIEVTTNSGVITKAHPFVKIALDAQKELLKLLQEFGCTSSSRKKVKDSVVKEDSTPLAEFLKVEKR